LDPPRGYIARACSQLRVWPWWVNHEKYLGVIFDKRIAWRLHIEMIEAKPFRTFIGIYSLLKSPTLNQTSIRH
jgi:hypothetical protein